MARATRAILLLLLPLLLPVFASCIGLDDLREQTFDARPDGGESDAGDLGCEGTPADLRLWKLHLGQSDYVVVRNVGDCKVELGGLHVFFDDLSELFPDFEVDCLVRLPAFALHAGAEVRVHEDGVEGDIDALDNAVSGCGEGVPFNPMRGGVVYLCDGQCDLDRVLDMVAWNGDREAPELRFRQHFEGTLTGVSIATQDSAHFRRVATTGRAPSFLASDWRLETRYLHADFDHGVELELNGAILGFEPEPGEPATVSTTAEDPIGESSLRLTHRGGNGRSEGLGVPLDFVDGRPSYLSYFARIDAQPATGGYVDLHMGELSVVLAGFDGRSLGTEHENGERTAVVVSAGTFHQVELRNLDWRSHDYDLYIDRVLVAARVPFFSNVNNADRLSLYDVSSNASADYDELEAWR